MDRMYEALLAAVGIALAVSLAAGGWLFFERRDAQIERDDLQEELDEELAKPTVEASEIDAAVAGVSIDWVRSHNALVDCLNGVNEVADTLYAGAIEGTAGPLFGLIVDELRAQHAETCAASDAVTAEIADTYPDVAAELTAVEP